MPDINSHHSPPFTEILPESFAKEIQALPGDYLGSFAALRLPMLWLASFKPTNFTYRIGWDEEPNKQKEAAVLAFRISYACALTLWFSGSGVLQ